jgi:hypothetical protein
MSRIAVSTRLNAGLLAGFGAVCVHTVLLRSADLFDLEVESGGLFRLLRLYFGATFTTWGVDRWWASIGLPMPGTMTFWVLFHTFVGILFGAFYALVVEPFLRGAGWYKGGVFSLLPWIINSVVVMPLLGNGFAAMNTLSPGGMVWFFVANTLFGILLGHWYERLIDRSAPPPHTASFS